MVNIRNRCLVYLGCTLLVLCVPRIGLAQGKEKSWTLRACIDYARQYNLQVQYVRVSEKGGQVDMLQAKAQLFPSLVFSTNQGWSHQRRLQADGDMASQSAYSGDYTLNGSMTLYNGGKLQHAIRQQEKKTEALGYDVAVTGNDTEISVTEVYLQILYANESLKTNRQTLENSLAQLKRSKELLDAGSISKSDYAQLEAQYSNDQYRVVQAENTLVMNKLQLKQLLELELEDSFEILFPELSETDILLPVPSLADVYRTAVAVMPEIRSSQLGTESAVLGKKLAEADRLPLVSLSASVNTGNDSESGGSFTKQVNDRLTENAGVKVSIPIANRRQVRSAVAKAKLQVEAAKLDEVNVRKQLLRTVESLHQDLLSAQSRYGAAMNNVKAALSSFRLVQEQFDAGMKNTVELLTEKNNYLSAIQEQIQAKYQAILARELLNFYRNEPIEI